MHWTSTLGSGGDAVRALVEDRDGSGGATAALAAVRAVT